jgi:hypothetical protein
MIFETELHDVQTFALIFGALLAIALLTIYLG